MTIEHLPEVCCSFNRRSGEGDYTVGTFYVPVLRSALPISVEHLIFMIHGLRGVGLGSIGVGWGGSGLGSG